MPACIELLLDFVPGGGVGKLRAINKLNAFARTPLMVAATQARMTPIPACKRATRSSSDSVRTGTFSSWAPGYPPWVCSEKKR